MTRTPLLSAQVQDFPQRRDTLIPAKDSKNIFMIFSGSSALKLSQNPDAAIRLLNIPIYPLTYSEYLKLQYGK